MHAMAEDITHNFELQLYNENINVFNNVNIIFYIQGVMKGIFVHFLNVNI